MSVLARFIPNITRNLQRFITHALIPKANFHALSKEIPSITHPTNSFDMTTRNIVRCHFPRPSERKRIKRHGYWKRMSTEAGRRIIMRKILKGKHVLSH